MTNNPTGQGPAVVLEVATVDGRLVFDDWTRVRITRTLHELSGSFELEYDDRYRAQALRAKAAQRQAFARLDPLQPATLYINTDPVMRGWIEDLDWEADATTLRASIRGLDPGGDLLQSSANPNGPAEYKGLTCLQICQRLVAPFGFTVRAEVDVGAPIADFAIDVGESVFSALDKAVRQRAVLLTSDGLGGLVLTRSGIRRAPDFLIVPKDVLSIGVRLSARDRFSDYYVKGQSRGHGRTGGAPLDGTAHPLPSPGAEGSSTAAHSRRPVSTTPLDGTAFPLGAGPAVAPVSQSRAASILQQGHAIDPLVTRYRPRVWVTRTGGGGSPHQVLAEWHMRVARARADHRRFTVTDFRAGSPPRLWRPNEIVAILERDADPYDMLIEGVSFSQDEGGSRTELTVVPPEAYDLEPLPPGRRHHATDVGKLPG